MEKYLDLDFDVVAADTTWQCLCCKLECCCSYQHCAKDHRHCIGCLISHPISSLLTLLGFTYRRTQQRHTSVAPKWTKRKKGEGEEDGDEDEPEARSKDARPKRKYTRRAKSTTDVEGRLI